MVTWPRSTSGAVHSGVPAWLLADIHVLLRTRDSPKSHTCRRQLHFIAGTMKHTFGLMPESKQCSNRPSWAGLLRESIGPGPPDHACSSGQPLSASLQLSHLAVCVLMPLEDTGMTTPVHGRSRATSGLKIAVAAHTHLASPVLVYQQVWRLKIPVHNGRAARVQVVHAPCHIKSHAKPPLVI